MNTGKNKKEILNLPTTPHTTTKKNFLSRESIFDLINY